MIISRTPFRTSFFGGGTDYPAWFRANGGEVLSAAIDKYCYISARHLPPFFPHRHRIIYSRIENAGRTKDIRHPAVRGVFEFLNVDSGIEMHHDGDLPARTGLGSSSSFTVGLLNAMHALNGVSAGPERLAREAIHVEQNVLQENVGSQDQVQVAFGGLNRIYFENGGGFRVEPLGLGPERAEELERHLLLFFTGFSRNASDIAGKQIGNVGTKKKELSEIQAMAGRGAEILSGGEDILEFGRLLHASWLLKRTLSDSITTPAIDAMYEAARSAGAAGGKLIGAGGGGFVLLFVPPGKQPAVREKLGELVCVPVKFDYEGSRIIFKNHESSG